jgi:hypothetical protein
MNFLIWNVRGLNHPSKQREVKSLINIHKIGLICLIETRVKENEAAKIRDAITSDWGFVFNYEKHFLGRIWVCWKKTDYEVTVIDKCDQSINCCIKSLKTNLCWFHSFVYGANKGLDRKLLWSNLSAMKTKVDDSPWMICGDFNVVKSLAEKWGSDRLNAYEVEFGQCLNDLEVLDLNFSGSFYTWTNKSEEPRFVARKLDRVLANMQWMNNFVEFKSGGISDHSPIFVSIGVMQSFGPKPFKFYSYWLEHKDFLNWVEEGWNVQVDGFHMYQLYVKLKVVKAVLKQKNETCFGNLKQKVLQARDKLDLAQKEVISSLGRADCLLKERECLHAFVSLAKAEESFLKQKSRNQWLKLGDQNNGFFHRSLKVKQAKNTITHLWDEQGQRVDDVEQIKLVAKNFYKKLLGSNLMTFTDEKAARISQLVSVDIPAEKSVLLEKEVTEEEIRETLFSMKSNKAPGPDGYTAEFFKAAWHIIGKEVVAAIKDFFNSGLLLKEVNATILTLVPKKINPSAMGDFRPIACCNVIYKCITKIISNRMLPLMGNLVSMNQSAFIPSRSISENVLLAQEIVRNYHKDKGKPRCTLKIDLMKAYDSVNWEFLICCLHCFGFPKKFVSWIKECVTSPKFFVCINGSLVGYFEGKKGLRQGDPLSPYLFVLAIEVLSKIMAATTGPGSSFKYHPNCFKMKLTHLFFADDLLILGKIHF